jgi:hypothetical protein
MNTAAKSDIFYEHERIFLSDVGCRYVKIDLLIGRLEDVIVNWTVEYSILSSQFQ